MSIAPTEPQAQGAESALPSTLPCMPVVEVKPDDLPRQVFVSQRTAVAAAKTRPADRFFDSKGRRLELVEADGEAPRLEARGAGDRRALRVLLLNALRKSAALEPAGGSDAAEAKAVVHWLAEAPSLVDLLHGLGLIEPDETDEIHLPACKSCNWIQKLCLGRPPCC
ncbi:MAG: hypothetical protein QOJ63_3625 [Solirubrobacteraceae bacterium]|jgi:hypothetical protein|nr:hypothetical protein [Solirubrobacteraceae bacterium]